MHGGRRPVRSRVCRNEELHPGGQKTQTLGPGFLARQGGQLFVGHSLKEGLRNVGCYNGPSLTNSFGDKELLRAPGGGARVAVDIAILGVIKTANGKPSSYVPDKVGLNRSATNFSHSVSAGLVTNFSRSASVGFWGFPFAFTDPPNVDHVLGTLS